MRNNPRRESNGRNLKNNIYRFMALLCLIGMNNQAWPQTPSCDVQVSDIVFDDISYINMDSVRTANGVLSYSCHNPTANNLNINACFLLNPQPQGQFFALTSSEGDQIPFQLRHGLTQQIWGNDFTQYSFGFIGNLAIGETQNGEFPIRAELLSSISSLPAGHYELILTNADSNVLLQQDPFSSPLSCQSGSLMTGFGFRVSADILSSCSISATDMDFGEILPTTEQYTTSSQIKLSCTPNTPYQMVLSSQQASGDSFRLLARDTNGDLNSIDYQLSDLDNPSSIWLPGIAKEGYIAGDEDKILNLQGVINRAHTPLIPGYYKDTVLVTLFY